MYIGIDEAGRGALCGAMYMAACDLRASIDGLDDSKKLSAPKREQLFERICANSEYVILSFSAAQIDSLGLSYVLGLGLECIKMHFKDDTHRLLFDGHTSYGSGVATMVRADASVPSVMAASILAKVARDRQMVWLDTVYPGYGLGAHKGYGTKAHINAICKLGLSPIHRKSFRPKALQPSLFD